MKLKFLLSILLLLVGYIPAQETDSTWRYNWDKDSTKSSEDWDWNSDIDWDFSFFKSERPTISLSYGLTKPSFKGSFDKMSQNRTGELKLGYTREKKAYCSDGLIKHKFSYLSISNSGYNLGLDKKIGEINSEMWRIGFGWDRGYGYKFGQSSIVLFNTWGFNWSQLKVEDSIINLYDREFINQFHDNFKFGTFAAGGIKIKPISMIEIEAGVERNAIYPAVLFWKASGSLILEAAAQGLVDKFINEVFASTPSAAPIVGFLLKNGLSFAIYELRKEKVNWPFDSPTPLMVDSYKIGLNFVF